MRRGRHRTGAAGLRSASGPSVRDHDGNHPQKEIVGNKNAPFITQDRVFIVRQEQDADGKAAAAAALLARGVPVTVIAAQAVDPVVAGTRIDTTHELGCTNVTAVDEITLNGTAVLDGRNHDQDLFPLSIAVGSTQLWRVVNAATDAFLDLALVDEAGKSVPVRVLARDGAPVADDSGKPGALTPSTETQLVPPAGRVEFLVDAPALGHKIYFVSNAVARAAPATACRSVCWAC